MGLGRFGGGLGVTRWLAGQGANVLLTDLDTAERLADPLKSLGPLIESGQVRLRLGEHCEDDFEGADLVVANPAVPSPWDNRFLRAAWHSNVEVTTEIQLTIGQLNRHRIIGVTGSAGKSTTSAMIHHGLTGMGHRARLGGNLGGSLLGDLVDITMHEWIVLELSSAMLWWLGRQNPDAAMAKPGWSPHVAVVTNIRANHLDWHGSFKHYAASKGAITTAQRPGDAIVLSDPGIVGIWADANVSIPPRVARRVVEPVEADWIRSIQLKTPGAHNRLNARTAATAIAVAIENDQVVERALRQISTFPGLPHRLQLVFEHRGICCYNDSKSTTPESAILAVDSFPEGSRIHLIVGGYDKGSDLQPVADLAGRIAGVYAIGATGPAIHRLHPGVKVCGTLESAVSQAARHLQAGDILLLSPGCASWDQFTNYEARGHEFSRLVGEILAE